MTVMKDPSTAMCWVRHGTVPTNTIVDAPKYGPAESHVEVSPCNVMFVETVNSSSIGELSITSSPDDNEDEDNVVSRRDTAFPVLLLRSAASGEMI